MEYINGAPNNPQELPDSRYKGGTYKSATLHEKMARGKGRIASMTGAAVLALGVGNTLPEANEAKAEDKEEVTEGFYQYDIEAVCNDDDEPIIKSTLETTKDADFIFWQYIENDRSPIYHGYLDGHRESRLKNGWDELPQSKEQVEVYYSINSEDGDFNNEDTTTDGPVVSLEYPCEGSPDNDGNVGGPEYTINTKEIAGNTPAETAVLNSREHFTEASRVVVTTDQEFADALAGGPLAGAVNGPLLYSGPGNLPNITAEELNRLGTHEVLLLGGEDALSADVEQRIRDMGINVTRIAGPTRLETAVAIDEYMDQHTNAVSNKAYLVNGWKFADAVAVSGLAAQEGAPLQLTAADKLSETTRRHLENERSEINTVTAIGGTAVVRSQALRESGDAANARTSRLSGRNRYQTSEAVAEADFNRYGNEAQDAEASMYMAPANAFHGALAGAPLEGRQDNATLMLIPKDNLDLLSSFQRVVEGYKHTSWENAIVSGDVSDEVLQRVDDILDATSPVNE